MAHAENSIVINKPAEQVFNFLADGTNNPRWRPGVISIEKVYRGENTVGATYKQTLTGPGGRKIPGDYQITEFQPNTSLGFKVTTGPARPEGRFLLERATEGTKVSFSLDFQPKGLARLMDGMITRTMQAEVACLTNLKQVLEAEK